MKPLVLLILLFGFLCVKGQNVIIKYEYERDILGIPKSQLELRNIDLGNNAYKEKSTLQIYSDFSIWQKDSFSYYMQRENEPIQIALRPESFLKIYGSNQIFSSDANFDNRNEFRPRDVSSQNNWKIDRTKTKSILGLKCFYAEKVIIGSENSTNIEAWFTNEIPFPDCPLNDYAFQLPGLILELNVPSIDKHLRAIDIDFLRSSACNFEATDYYLSSKYDVSKRNQFYMALDRSSPYILSEETPQNVWLPYPKE